MNAPHLLAAATALPLHFVDEDTPVGPVVELVQGEPAHARARLAEHGPAEAERSAP